MKNVEKITDNDRILWLNEKYRKRIKSKNFARQ